MDVKTVVTFFVVFAAILLFNKRAHWWAWAGLLTLAASIAYSLIGLVY